MKFTLDDLSSCKEEFGENFEIPSKTRLENLKIGDLVKLIFRFENGEFVQVERMWVVISGVKDGKFVGNLDNEPFVKGSLKLGDEIKFDYKNVLEIYEK